jgi:hypothetical protein
VQLMLEDVAHTLITELDILIFLQRLLQHPHLHWLRLVLAVLFDPEQHIRVDLGTVLVTVYTNATWSYLRVGAFCIFDL